jgi:hypothetical protein
MMISYLFGTALLTNGRENEFGLNTLRQRFETVEFFPSAGGESRNDQVKATGRDGTTVQVNFNSRIQSRNFGRMDFATPLPPESGIAPSGTPLGSDLVCAVGREAISFHVATPHGRFQFFLRAPVLIGSDGYRTPYTYDWKKGGHDVFFEGYVRTVVGRVIASFMTASPDITSGGVTVFALRGSDGRGVLGNLHQWVKKKGWTWTDDPRGFATLRKGTSWAVIPLGGNQVKINGQWKDLPDFIVEKDDEWYLPGTGLYLLNGASG